SFLDKAMTLGIDYVATGHYAIIEKQNNRYIIRKSEDDKKDQTYALYNLTQFQLERTLMPCGQYKKSEIREIAKDIGLRVHNKKDSQEICFIPDNDHGKYIKNRFPSKVRQGNFVDKSGNILGTHKGIVYYTIGQRKGLDIAFGKPMYVVDINPFRNEVVLGNLDDLLNTELIAKDVNYIPFDNLKEPMEVEAKIRYSQIPSKAVITPLENDKVKVNFNEKQRAITKGQSVVFYKDDLLIGGGIIE
ncbi:tRNA 2-thiouridine(34) synthase MnmA, partial [Bacteroidales bacterium MSK.15.36]|nr:tRNA 2-thiouridine(34) synthase MnmA [Bacteroidales bacterium MSK.15.36]